MKRMPGAAVAMLMCFVLLAGAFSHVWAQTYRGGRYDRRTTATQSHRRYDRRANYDRRYDDERYNDRSVWERSRDKLTVAAGAGAGAVLGSVVGGKKGAVIGALVGASGSALYTYKPRERNDNRRYRR